MITHILWRIELSHPTTRGRFVKAIFPKAGARIGRLAIGATLRAAAPHQKLRRLRLQKEGKRRQLKVSVTKDDFRIQRMSRKAGTLVGAMTGSWQAPLSAKRRDTRE